MQPVAGFHMGNTKQFSTGPRRGEKWNRKFQSWKYRRRSSSSRASADNAESHFRLDTDKRSDIARYNARMRPGKLENAQTLTGVEEAA